MADPAFVMTPQKPPSSKFEGDFPANAIGINLSPLIAYFREDSAAPARLCEWASFCAELV
jgi:hypothetical protein